MGIETLIGMAALGEALKQAASSKREEDVNTDQDKIHKLLPKLETVEQAQNCARKIVGLLPGSHVRICNEKRDGYLDAWFIAHNNCDAHLLVYDTDRQCLNGAVVSLPAVIPD